MSIPTLRLPGSRPTGTPASLLAAARQQLSEAALTGTPAERYAAAHLAALRAAAAVVASRARPALPGVRSSRPISVWVLLTSVAEELSEWAAFFAAGARKRAAAEARIPGSVSAREADDLLRDAETFIAVVETKLSGVSQASLGMRVRG